MHARRYATRRSGTLLELIRVLLVVLVVLGGCARQSAVAPVVSEGTEPQPKAVILEAEGLGFLVGESSIRHMEFGTATFEDTKTALERQVDAKGDEQQNTECGEGPLRSLAFAGITVYFAEDKLAGWRVRPGALLAFTTADGVGLGSTRAELEESFGDVDVSDTSLGTEWSAGGFSGLLDGKQDTSTVEAMWSGMTCIAR